jgi:hypothetical protein
MSVRLVRHAEGDFQDLLNELRGYFFCAGGGAFVRVGSERVAPVGRLAGAVCDGRYQC